MPTSTELPKNQLNTLNTANRPTADKSKTLRTEHLGINTPKGQIQESIAPQSIIHDNIASVSKETMRTPSPQAITTFDLTAPKSSPQPKAMTLPTAKCGYTPTELSDAHQAFVKMHNNTFELPQAYQWFDTHADFIFDGALTLDALDNTNRQALTDFVENLNHTAFYLFGLLDPSTISTSHARHQHQTASEAKTHAPATKLQALLDNGLEPEHIIGDLLGLKLLHEDELLGLLEFEAPQDFRRFARIYTLVKNLYSTVDPEDDYTRLTDAYHPKNVISYLQNKDDIALLTAAAFHDFERYVPGIRMKKLPCAKLDETLRKQAMHPLNSAKLARHLLQKSPLTSAERTEVFALIRNHDAGPDGLTIEGHEYVPALSGERREKLIDLTNADTAAFFDFSPMQDPTVEVFVKNRLNTVIEKTLSAHCANPKGLSEKSKNQLANLALTQYVAGIKPLELTLAIDAADVAHIDNLNPLESALAGELEKLSARITKHAKRISPNMLGTVARLHAQRPRTQIDVLIHAALQNYDQMDKNLKSLKQVALAVMAAQNISRKLYLKKTPKTPNA